MPCRLAYPPGGRNHSVWDSTSVATTTSRRATKAATPPKPQPQPQFTTELEALIAIEANTRQALELLRQQNRKSFWSMLFLGSIASND